MIANKMTFVRPSVLCSCAGSGSSVTCWTSWVMYIFDTSVASGCRCLCCLWSVLGTVCSAIVILSSCWLQFLCKAGRHWWSADNYSLLRWRWREHVLGRFDYICSSLHEFATSASDILEFSWISTSDASTRKMHLSHPLKSSPPKKKRERTHQNIGAKLLTDPCCWYFCWKDFICIVFSWPSVPKPCQWRAAG